MSAHRKTAAYHQAGHAVMRWSQGVASRPIHLPGAATSPYVEPQDVAESQCQLDLGDRPKSRRRMESLVRVLLAGPYAQRRYRPRSHWRSDGENDLRSAGDLLSLYTASDRETKAYLQLLEIQTQQELEHENVWMRVEALAAALLEKEKLSAARVRTILRDPPLLAQRLEQIMKYAMPIPFTNISRIDVELTETGPGTQWAERSRGFVWPQTYVDHLHCSSVSLCSGGLELTPLIDEMIEQGETQRPVTAACSGAIGDRPCATTFEGQIRLQYLDQG